VTAVLPLLTGTIALSTVSAAGSVGAEEPDPPILSEYVKQRVPGCPHRHLGFVLSVLRAFGAPGEVWLIFSVERY
jgi:hypothetical protein